MLEIYNEMLFDLKSDPHQQNDLASAGLAELTRGRDLLGQWLGDMVVDAARGRDPHDNVMQEGGPYHVRGKLESYLQRLRKTERSHLADQLAEKYASEL